MSFASVLRFNCQRSRAKPLLFPKWQTSLLLAFAFVNLHFIPTGMDCFGPYTVKIVRRTDKRWGIIFKCLTTHWVHLDLLSHMNTDSFLMVLRLFIARRGKPFKLLSYRGTNFIGGARELKEATPWPLIFRQSWLNKRLPSSSIPCMHPTSVTPHDCTHTH